MKGLHVLLDRILIALWPSRSVPGSRSTVWLASELLVFMYLINIVYDTCSNASARSEEIQSMFLLAVQLVLTYGACLCLQITPCTATYPHNW